MLAIIIKHIIIFVPFKRCPYTVQFSLVAQSCPTLCDPMDCSLPGFSVHGILQARTGVGCHFLLQCMKVETESEVAQSCLTPSDPRDCSPPGSSSKSTGVGCHSPPLLLGNFLNTFYTAPYYYLLSGFCSVFSSYWNTSLSFFRMS